MAIGGYFTNQWVPVNCFNQLITPLLADLIIATFFFLKFSFSPGVRAIHRSQFQATSALWSKASNLHYSLMRLPPPPPPPSPAKHTIVLRRAPSQPWGVPGWARSAFCDEPSPTPRTAGSIGGNPGVRECQAGAGRPSVMDPSSVTDERSELKCRIVVSYLPDRHRFCHKKWSTPVLPVN